MKEVTFRLVSAKDKQNTGTRSVYRVDNTKTMNALRVKLAFTFSAIGACAPLFVSVCELLEKELPHYKCITLVIEMIFIGGEGSNGGNKDVVHFILMQAIANKYDQVPDRQRYKYYKDNLIITFVT